MFPATEHPVEAPTEKVTAPVPDPPLEERVEVVPYCTVEGVAIAVRVAWVALRRGTVRAALVAER